MTPLQLSILQDVEELELEVLQLLGELEDARQAGASPSRIGRLSFAYEHALDTLSAIKFANCSFS